MTKILAINPGSTSTKVSVYEEERELFKINVEHTQQELEMFEEIYDQLDFRKEIVLTVLKEQNIDINNIDIIVARGGLLPPVEAGAYQINDDMVYQLRYHPQNNHASNLGAGIAYIIANKINVKSYVYDPVTVDELIPIVRITGLKEINRKGMGHNLNMRAAAMKFAKDNGKKYEKISVVVVHLGGGISLTLHNGGKMIDMISDDEGPFSPERAGGLPAFQVIKETSKSDEKSMMKKVKTQGGLMSHLGTTDSRKVEEMIRVGDENAKLVYEAMALNIAKNIAKLSVVVNGMLDAIVLTGGIAHSKMITEWIEDRVSFIAPVVVFPGENEMQSLALGALRVVNGMEKAKIFTRLQ